MKDAKQEKTLRIRHGNWSELQFLRSSLWLPLILPSALFLVLHAARAMGWNAQPPLHIVPATVVGSLLVGGIPYALIAAWAYWFLRSRTTWDAILLSLILPIPVAFAVGLLVAMATYVIAVPTTASFREIPLELTIQAVFRTIVLGYAYVALVHGLRVILKYRGIIVPCREHPLER